MPKKYAYSIVLRSLGILLLSSCSQAHQLGMEANPQELLNMKLNNPNQPLTSDQGISLIKHCVQLGERNAAAAVGKEIVMVLGNTGAGKSTTINALMGCKMTTSDPETLGVDGFEDLVVVSQDSVRPEIMPIGHGNTSKTFMPQIAPDPQNPNRAYCDCPGFLDNRGAEINIANAINTRRVLQRSSGVKAVFLTNYHGLLVDRGHSIQNLTNMCQQMFGGIDNLRTYQNSILLGVTKAPLYNRRGQPFSIHTVRSKLSQVNTPTAQLLANRIFLFDPLNIGRDNPDFWSVEQCCAEINKLVDSIPQPKATTLFQAVLTGDDRTQLQCITRHQVDAMRNQLEQRDYAAASRCWNLLQPTSYH